MDSFGQYVGKIRRKEQMPETPAAAVTRAMPAAAVTQATVTAGSR